MKTSGAVAAAALLLQSQNVQAGPIASALVPRQKADILKSFLEFALGFFPGEEEAWDIGKNKNMCKIWMETEDGGNCYAKVECDDGVEYYNKDGAGWNVCFVGGRQYFKDPRIGEFSITFKEKDGKSQGEGLTTPILQLKDIGDWKEIPVNDLASDYNEHTECNDASGDGTGASPFRDCGKGPFVCHWGDFGNGYIWTSRKKKWECGVPKTGKGGGGLDSNGEEDKDGYRSGQCGIHVTHYQKPDPSKDKYSLEVPHINDANENRIGGHEKGGPEISVESKLEWTVVVKAGNVDADPISFAYGKEKWTSDDEQCSTGKYDSGKREMDCSFTC